MTESDDIDYAAWGELFFPTVVTTERVLAGVNVLAGRPIEVGPLGVGPGRLAKVKARGAIGTAEGRRTSESPVSFEVTLPVALEFMIDLTMDRQKFDAELDVPLIITARAKDDLRIELDVTPPTPEEVAVRLQAKGLRASFTQYAAGVEGELQRFVAKYVAREVEKPHVRSARTIDVAAGVDKAMETVGPKPASADELTEDLPDALESEILESAGDYLDEAGKTEEGNS